MSNLLKEIEELKYSKTELCTALQRIGFSKTVSGANEKLRRLRNQGKFTPPTLPIGRYGKKQWAFSLNQIKDIVRAFGPGGIGEWHYGYRQLEETKTSYDRT